MIPMQPGYDRRRSGPVRETDYKATTMLQGHGLAVVRIETTAGSNRAHLTWRNQPGAKEVEVAEMLLSAYSNFSHGT